MKLGRIDARLTSVVKQSQGFGPGFFAGDFILAQARQPGVTLQVEDSLSWESTANARRTASC
jgi:hypothetical protein